MVTTEALPIQTNMTHRFPIVQDMINDVDESEYDDDDDCYGDDKACERKLKKKHVS